MEGKGGRVKVLRGRGTSCRSKNKRGRCRRIDYLEELVYEGEGAQGAGVGLIVGGVGEGEENRRKGESVK